MARAVQHNHPTRFETERVGQLAILQRTRAPGGSANSSAGATFGNDLFDPRHELLASRVERLHLLAVDTKRIVARGPKPTQTLMKRSALLLSKTQKLAAVVIENKTES